MSSSLNEFDSIWAPPDTAVDDRGVTHAKVQNAIDNANSHVMVGPGTFEEQLSITTDGLAVRGAGGGTIIDGTDGQAIDVTASNVDVEQLAARNTRDGAGNADVFDLDGTADGATVRFVRVLRSDGRGFRIVADNCTLIGCHSDETDNSGFDFSSSSTDSVAVGCVARDATGSQGFELNGSRIGVSGCVSDNAGQNGFFVTGTDCGIVASTSESAGADGIDDDGTRTVIVGNTVTNETDDAINTDDATNPIVFGNNPASANQGASAWSQSTITSDTTASDTDSLWVDASSNTVTVTLPSPSQNVHVRVVAINASNTVTLARNGTENINGSSSDRTLSAGESLTVESDGTNWWIV